jgi:hypothetical protein
MFRTLALALLVLVGLAARADAANFVLRGDTITMSGRIGPTDPLKLSRLIGEGAHAIVLESPGGLVAAASYMAEMIREAGLTTIVSGDCASACTVMFYAGTDRRLSGRLGFHRATDDIGTANYTEAMRRYGAPLAALEAVRTTRPSSITWMR